MFHSRFDARRARRVMTKLSALTCPTTNNDDDEHAEEPNSTSWERDMYCQPRAVLYAFGRSVEATSFSLE